MVINIICNQHKCLHRCPGVTCSHPEPEIHNRGRNAICYSKEDCDIRKIKPGPPKYPGCATCIDPTPEKCYNTCPFDPILLGLDEAIEIQKQDYYG